MSQWRAVLSSLCQGLNSFEDAAGSSLLKLPVKKASGAGGKDEGTSRHRCIRVCVFVVRVNWVLTGGMSARCCVVRGRRIAREREALAVRHHIHWRHHARGVAASQQEEVMWGVARYGDRHSCTTAQNTTSLHDHWCSCSTALHVGDPIHVSPWLTKYTHPRLPPKNAVQYSTPTEQADTRNSVT